jgi:hypothetical protein
MYQQWGAMHRECMYCHPATCMQLQVGKEEEEQRTKKGFFVTFVADLRPGWTPADSQPSTTPQTLAIGTRPLCQRDSGLAHSASPQSPLPQHPLYLVSTTVARLFHQAHTALLKLILAAVNCSEAADAWGVSHKERGIVGVIVFDTLAYHVPAMWLGKNMWQRRHNVAYISNVAIVPGCRR